MPAESYDDDEDEIEGPKSSFGTYLAEGDALFKQSEFKKALESYSLVSKAYFFFVLHLFGIVVWWCNHHITCPNQELERDQPIEQIEQDQMQSTD